MAVSTPYLGLEDRDRRWDRVRNMMAEKSVDCLIVAGLNANAWSRFDTYLSYLDGKGVVIFPLEGDPTYLCYPGAMSRHRAIAEREGGQCWIKDWKPAFGGACWAKEIRERRLERAKIGVVGLNTLTAYELEGVIPFNSYDAFRSHLPNAQFVELTESYSDAMRVLSSAETEMYRHSAKIGKNACEAMLEATRVGADERDIYADIVSTIYRHGADPISPLWTFNGGSANPLWVDQGLPPHIVKSGDRIWSEILVVYGGFQTQHHISIMVDPVSDAELRYARAAEQSYQAGVKALRPGVTFSEVVDAMEKPILEMELGHGGPLIHSLNPQSNFNGRMGVGVREEIGAVIPPFDLGGEKTIQAWTCFELEPDAGLDDGRAIVGSSVLVTESGVEEMNDLATKVHILS